MHTSPATPPAPYRACPACGGWARGDAACARCGWEGVGLVGDPLAIRVLLDVAVDADGHVRFSRAWIARLPWLEDDPTFRAALGVAGQLPDEPRPWAEALLEGARGAVRAHLARLGASMVAAGSVPVMVSLRVQNHHPTLDLSALARTGLRVVPFDASMLETGRGLADDALAWRHGELDLRSRSGHDAPRVVLEAARPVVVEALLVIAPTHEPCAWAEVQRPTAPGHPVEVAVPELEARHLHALRAAPAGWSFAARILGRAEPVRYPVPPEAVASLPPEDAVVDLYLHPGSVTIRLCLGPPELLPDGRRAAPLPELWQSLPTAELARALGLAPFEKEATTRDPAVFAAWVAAVLPALAAWSQRARGAWLRRVVVATPGDRRFAEHVMADATVRDVARRALLEGVRCVPEPTALAAHVRPVLRSVAEAIAVHRKQHDQAVRVAQARVKAWEDARRMRENPLLKVFASDPGERPADPPAFEPLGVAEGWLEEHLERDPGIDALVLLDAGGSSLDVALWKAGAPSVTARFAEAGSERVTPFTASSWDALTRAVYDAALAETALSARATFEYRGHLVVLSGGGLRNPCLRERLDAAWAAVGYPFAPAVDAPTLLRIAQAARDRGLETPAIARFLAVHERDGGFYGRFDVVDGLVAEGGR